MAPRGRLIVFEGGEGAGKTTQLRRLAAQLNDDRISHYVFREPGGTPLGDSIRDLLLHTDGHVEAAAEAALFIASRAQLVGAEVRPALERGKHVLLDRFLLSTYAYQIHGRGLPEEELRVANRLATRGLVPDLTVLLTMPPEMGLARAGARGAADRIERADVDFHQRVATAFAAFGTPEWQQTHPECGPIVAVDARGTVDEVGKRVSAAVYHALPELDRSTVTNA
ncbi:MAG: dTMP kinase [Gemmatimonadaceae bacterium]|nr:dTMP kinase [Gemmatimonadaceae bacterium]